MFLIEASKLFIKYTMSEYGLNASIILHSCKYPNKTHKPKKPDKYGWPFSKPYGYGHARRMHANLQNPMDIDLRLSMALPVHTHPISIPTYQLHWTLHVLGYKGTQAPRKVEKGILIDAITLELIVQNAKANTKLS